MRSKQFDICTECYDEIEKQGQPLIKLLTEVCAQDSINKTYVFNCYFQGFNAASVSFLEKKGIIVSTEVSKHELGIKPSCRAQEYATEIPCYCWCANAK